MLTMSSKLLALRQNRSYLRVSCEIALVTKSFFAVIQMSIATFIKQDLIAGIRSGEIESERLTLDDLSKRYSVSATPVGLPFAS